MNPSRHGLLLMVLVAALAAGCEGPEGAPGADGAQGPAGENGQDGTNGQDGGKGDKGDPGDPGNDAPWAGTLSITVQKDGAGVAGATIKGVGADKTTNAQGLWTGEVAIGAYVLTISAPNLVTVENLVVGVQAESNTAITVPMVSDGTIPGMAPDFSVPSWEDETKPTWLTFQNVGFDRTIELGAAVIGLTDDDTPAANLTYTWTKKSGPAVVLTGANTANPTVELPGLDEIRKYDYHGEIEYYDMPDTMGVIAFAPDNAGRYVFTVKISDPEGHVVAKDVAVSSMAFNTTGLRQVALDQPVHVRGVAGKGTYSWSLTTKPNGSTAAIEGNGRFASFRPDVAGKYVVSEGGQTLEIYANPWNGAQGSAEASCTVCHKQNGMAADQFTPYNETDHAGILHHALTDPAEDHYAARCMACHTVGMDPASDNGGIDDLMGDWRPNPYGSQQNWDNFVAQAPNAVKLANIQCENCHGPQGGTNSAHMTDAAARNSVDSAVCASCHASGAHHDRYYLWHESNHANYPLVTTSTSGSCARCHNAEGFIAWTDGFKATGSLPSSSTAGTTNISCAACHDPHEVANPAQLRLHGDLGKLPSGVEVHGAGAGALCMACHNHRNAQSGMPRNDVTSGATQDDRDPHAPSQTDVLYGVSAYFMDGPRPSAHLAIEDTCVTCHMKIAPAGMHVSNTNHSFHTDETVCAACHSEHVTGGAMMAQTHALIVEVEGLLISKGLAAINAAGVGYKVTPIDHADDCTGTADQVVNVLPSGISHVTTSHGRMSYELEFATPVTFNFPASCGGPTARQMTHVVVQLAKFKKADNSLIFPAGHTINKAFWNFLLIEEDKSHGAHNPSFALEVLDNTIEALSTL